MIDSEFLIEHFALFLPMVIMYAELHFRFKWSNSRYFQKEPEILADLPIRIEPGNDIPILLIIKDAHIFPIILEKVEIKIIKNNKIIQSKIFSYNADIDFSWWDDTITIDATGISGDVEINVEFSYVPFIITLSVLIITLQPMFLNFHIQMMGMHYMGICTTIQI